jgi:cbb3-type cytochrome oxidase maturation protein
VFLVYLVIWAFTLIAGASAVWALAWAVQSGQFRDFRAGAASIFDDAEPIGQPTDRFPGEGASRR